MGFLRLAALAFLAMLLTVSSSVFATEHGRNNEYLLFNIPQQRADLALILFAEQTDLTLIFPVESVRQKTANRLVGKFPIGDAAEKLLRGTGLNAKVGDDGQLTIGLERSLRREQTMYKKNKLSSAILAALTTMIGVQAVSEESPVVEGDLMEEIVVTAGYRASLKQAIDMKRDEVGFSDSIVATDIANFPDQNLAEALQRVPGVAIDRDRGLGTRVNIRSLGTQFTHTTINNIATASGSGGRAVDFSVFASELIQSVTVKKSPSAADEEGGVAGIVAIQTARPFDYDGFKVAGSLETTDNSSSGERDPRGAFLISNTFADDKWGALFSYATGDRSVRVDDMYVDEFYTLGGRLYDREGTDATTPANLDPDLTYPEKIQNSATLVEQEVWGSTGSIQFRPSDTLEFALDLMVGEMDEHRDEYLHDTYLGRATSASDLTADEYGMVTGGTFENVLQEFKSYRDLETKTYSQVGFTVDWQVGAWDIDALIGYNKAKREKTSHYFKWATDAHNLIYELQGDYFSRSSSTFDPLTNTDSEFSNYDKDIWNVNNDKKVYELNFRRDLELASMPALSSVQFGTRYSQKSADHEYGYTRVKGSTLTVNPDGSVSTSEEYLGEPISLGGSALLSDILAGGGYQGLGVKDWQAGDIDAALARYYPADGVLPIDMRENSYYRVDEDVLSLYAMGDFDFEISGLPTQVNLGVRYVSTDQTSYGYQNLDGEWSDGPVNFKADYDDVLPSLNVRMNLQDDLLLRLAVAKVMSRAELRDLSGSLSISQNQMTIRAGNLDLEPLRANQADLSLEWYFADESLMAATIFYKDLKSVISTDENGTMEWEGELYDLTTKVNVEGIKLEGAELIFQMPFTFLPGALDGFGVNMNYTYVDATRGLIKGTDREIPMFGLSKDSYNFTGYYEKYGFDFRMAYNFKSGSVAGEVGGYPKVVDDYGQWDISAGYEINENFKVTLKAINVTDEEAYFTWDAHGNSYPAAQNIYGRRISLGVRGSF